MFLLLTHLPNSSDNSLGLYIGLGALAFNYTFPLKITEPPYNWSEVSVESIKKQYAYL
jgi:hypothetical protein